MNVRTAVHIAFRTLGFAALGVLLLTTGCASRGKTVKGAKVPADQIAVYESTELLHSQYTLVEHIWIDSWRANFTYPRFSTEAEGLDAMKRAASNAGANALLHAICVDGATKSSQRSHLYCYGDAIRLN